MPSDEIENVAHVFPLCDVGIPHRTQEQIVDAGVGLGQL